MSNFFGLDKDDKFVDIHGREIPTITIGPKKEIVCPLSNLKQTGVGIFQKSQYAKLDTVDKDFGPDFVDAMLEAAKSYMLANKVSFSHEQIMISIENCKEKLINPHSTTQTHKQNILFKDRIIEANSNDDIVIKINSKQTQNPIKKSPQSSNSIKSLSPQQSNSIKSHNTILKKFPKKGFTSQTSSTHGSTNGKTTENQSKSPKLKLDLNQPEYEVIVTAIDKHNCIWARDLANNDIFEKIHIKVNEEAKFQKIASKPWVMDKVYMAKDEDNWFRCKIVKYTPLTVFFLDYGNIAEVEEIRNVSEELAKTPCMAVRLTFKKREDPVNLEDILKIKKVLKNDDGTIFVNILNRSSESLNSSSNSFQTLDISELNQEIDDWNEEPTFFTKPPILSELENNLKVAIIYLRNNEFYVRSKDCFMKLREIEKEIESYVTKSKKIEKPQINQLILYDGNDEKHYRGIITNIIKNKIEIELLDYGEILKVDGKSIKTINEKLSTTPITIINCGKLVGFEKQKFTETHMKFIEEIIKKQKKFTVSLGFDDEFDLYDGELLSEQLINLEKKSGKILLQDMKTYKPETGLKAYICGFYKNSKEFALVSSHELQEHMDQVVRSEVQDTVPYLPIPGEICLCYYVDNWYRCVATRIFEHECEVLLLDFGNIELIKKENIRKPSPDLAKIPILAIPCVLTDLPETPNIEEELKKLIIDGEIYLAEIKKISEGKWHVIIPALYKKIKDL